MISVLNLPSRSHRSYRPTLGACLGLAILAFGSAGAQAEVQAQPGRLVIVGGALKADNEAVYREILGGRSGTGPFCVIPTAGATPETGMAGPVANFDRYGGAGTAKGVLISVNKPETARDPAVVAQLRACSGFYFIGGIQTRVSGAFRPDGKSTPAYDALMQRWREGAVVAGSSAGAAIMSDPMIASGTSARALARGVTRASLGADEDDSTSGLSITHGLGLFPAALADQHFLARGRFGRLLVALVDLDQYDLAFGVDENTALVVDGNSVRAVGASGVIVFDERGATRSGRGATGIALHLLGAGDRFDLNTRAVTQLPGKLPLPAATGDSVVVRAPANAFAPWEFLHVLDRLGRSPQPELAMQVSGGEIIARKAAGFRAVGTAGAGVQNTPAGLGLTGLTVELRRPAALGSAGAQPTSAADRAVAWTAHQSMAQESWFRGLAWRPAGPVKIGARIEAVAIPPGNTATIYAGVGSGNLWKTVNNGLTWKPIFEHESAFAIGDIAISQSNPNVVWVGTGEAQPRYAGYAYPGTGVFKSVDAGASWTNMGLGETRHIGKVVIHPTNPNVVYVAAMGRQWSTNRERGVFRTTDGGANWEHVLYVNDSTGVADLVMDPSDPRTLYAWAWQIDASSNGGLFKSRDGGTTWRRITAGLPQGLMGRAGIDVAPGSPNVLYLFLDNRAPTTVERRPYVGGEVYRSNDRGESWRKVNTDDIYEVFGVFGWKFADIRIDPRSAEHVYILGNRAFESFDGGATWRRLGDRILRLHDTEGRALHLDHHELVIDPANPDRLLLGNDGGLFVSSDAGASWLHVNNIPVTQMYFVAVDDKIPYRIYAGTQDNAALFGPSTASLDDAVPDPWRSVYLDRWTGGDSYVTLPDPTDDRFVYYEHQNGGMRRMNISGASILTGGPSSQDIRPRLPRGEPPLRFSWYTPFFISPYDPHTLYAGGNRVLKTTDRGATWSAVSPDLGDPAGTDRGTVTTGALTMLMESPLRRGMLVGGTEGGRVWLTTDDDANWRRIDAGLPRKWVSRVIASAADVATLYVSFTGFREDDSRTYLFASNDTGRTWRSIANNLPHESVNVIKEDPADASILYVGTDLGVYVSRDRGGNWESLSASLPSTPVHDLAVQARERELVIGTHGRGAWILDLVPVHDRSPTATTVPLKIYPIRDAIADYFPWETVPGDRRGRNEVRFQVASAAAGTAIVVVADSAGRAVRRWQTPVMRGVNTLTWDLQAEQQSGALGDARAGRYTIEVSVGSARESGIVQVLADPILSRPPGGR